MPEYKKLPSGLKTESGVIYAGPCLFFGFVCITGLAQKNINIYDNASDASGIVVEPWVTDPNKPVDGHEHSTPVQCANGLFLSTPGTGEQVEVYYWPYGGIG